MIFFWSWYLLPCILDLQYFPAFALPSDTCSAECARSSRSLTLNWRGEGGGKSGFLAGAKVAKVAVIVLLRQPLHLYLLSVASQGRHLSAIHSSRSKANPSIGSSRQQRKSSLVSVLNYLLLATLSQLEGVGALN